MEAVEIRLRLVEAAAKNPTPHAQGYAAGVLETVAKWEKWVFENSGAKTTLGLPKKAP